MFDKLRQRLGLARADGRETSPSSSGETKWYLEGAYRLHLAGDVNYFTTLAVEAFPEFEGRISCFGADWLGRQFATDSARISDGEPQVLMLEPGTGEALEIPVGYTHFHEREIFERADAAVAFPFFKQWEKSGGSPPGYSECISYKVPLFLGGPDDVTNLELADFDVYWTISAQLLAKVRNLPPGTSIGGVSISD